MRQLSLAMKALKFPLTKLRNIKEAAQKFTCRAQLSNFSPEHFVSSLDIWHMAFSVVPVIHCPVSVHLNCTDPDLSNTVVGNLNQWFTHDSYRV